MKLTLQMRNRLRLLACLFFAFSFSSISTLSAQNVTVSGALVGNGSYSNLSTAFAAINAGAQTSATINISIVGNTTEGPSPAVLNQGAWTSLTVSPSGGNRSISGTTTLGSPLIDLNGADRVTIDGLNSGGNALTIANAAGSSTTTAAAVLFRNDATMNLLTRCSLKGSALGVVEFGVGTTTGNDNNTVSYCDIGDNNFSYPVKGVLCNGTNTSLSNSNITISNCSIHDYYGANYNSFGVSLMSGHDNWTISNNRFYQSSSRAITGGGARHAAIHVSTGPSNSVVTISGNVIGYSNANGTGTYDIVGGNAVRVHGIYVETTSTTAQTNILNNQISNINVTGAMWDNPPNAIFALIYVKEGNSTISGNRIGSLTTPGSIHFETTIGTNYAVDASIIRHTGGGYCTMENDTIGGIVIDALNNCTLYFDVIQVKAGTYGTNTYNANLIGSAAAPITVNNSGSNSRIYGLNSETGRVVMTNNVISHFTAVTGLAATGTNAGLIGIRFIGNGPAGSIVKGNKIQALKLTGTTGQVSLVGFAYAGSSNVVPPNRFEGNIIQNLEYNNPAGNITGLYVQDGKDSLVNNMIRLGMDAAGNSITAGIELVGIHTKQGDHTYLHNSIYIGGSGVTGIAKTYAVKNDVNQSDNNYFNNIFMNARSNGTGVGKHYALQFQGNTVNSVWNTGDYNNIIANGNGGVFAYYAGRDRPNVYVWRTDYGHDAHSMTVDPQFVNPMGSVTTGDLHLGPISPMEGAGSLSNSTALDIDGQTRSAMTPSDIGADAANVASIVSLSPAITYTAPSHYCSSADLSFTANITLAAGVPTVGSFQPRVYYRKNNGPVLSSQGVLSSGNGTNGTWTFNILAANYGGFVAGDVISYYVIAQDVSGAYVTGSPKNGLLATDVNTVTQHPWEWNTYGGLQGTYGIGAGETFTTLTGAVQAYNTSCLLGPVKFALKDTVYYYETFPISAKANPDASPTKPLTVQPDAGVISQICGDAAPYLFEFAGADYVHLNGSNTTVANEVCPRVKAIRSLKLRNTGGFATVGFHNTSLGDSATHNSVLNCNIYGGRNPDLNFGYGSAGVASAGATPNLPGDQNNFNLIENNYISYAQNGIYSLGGTNKNQHNRYRLNDIGLDQWIGAYGMMILNENAPEVYANNVTATAYDISLGYNSGLTDVSSVGLEVTNADVRYNVIKHLYTGSYLISSAGIAVAATFSGTTTIANNFVQDVLSLQYAPFVCASFYYGGGTGLFRLYHNTAKMTSSGGNIFTNFNHLMVLAIMGNGGNPANVDVRNNIFQTGASNSSLSNNVIGLGYTSTTGAYQNFVSNHNNLVPGGYTPYIGRTNGLGPAATTHVTRANWTGETGGDANSVSIVPNYFSFSDMHLPAANNVSLSNLGTPILLITDDIDCELRDPMTPDMGADEMETCPTPVAGTISAPATFCGQGNTILYGTGYSSSSQYRWQTSPAGLNTWTNTTWITPSYYPTGNLTSSTDFRLQVGCSNGAIVYSNVVTITVNTSGTPSVTIAASVPNPVCPGTSVTYTATAVNAGSAPSYQWFVNNIPAGTNSPTFLLANPTGGSQIKCTITSNAPCASILTATSSNMLVTVFDNVFPVWANCPTSQTVSTQTNNCTGVATWTAPTASDNCSLNGTTSNYNPGATFNLGTTTVNYSAADVAGNVSTCSFTVTVADQVAPTANCQNFSVQLNSNGFGSITTTNINNGSSDACGIASISLNNTGFGCANVGANTVVLTVTDLSGNTATCTANVQVSSQALVANATPLTTLCGYQVTCPGATDGTATVVATGGCPGYSYAWSNGATSQTAANLGAGSYQVTVTDAAGGVLVLPVLISAPAPFSLVGDTAGTCIGDTSGSIDLTVTGGNDCQPYSFIWSNGATTEDLTLLLPGTYAVTVTDLYGCAATDVFTVALLPTPSPSFTQSGNVLSATQVWPGYQWLRNAVDIPGATARDYTISMDGSYSLRVMSPSNCPGTSAPSVITAIEARLSLGLDVMPNPASDVFFLRPLQVLDEPIVVEVHDLLGQILFSQKLQGLSQSLELDARAWPAATYFLRVKTEDGRQQVFRLVVQR